MLKKFIAVNIYKIGFKKRFVSLSSLAVLIYKRINRKLKSFFFEIISMFELQ